MKKQFAITVMAATILSGCNSGSESQDTSFEASDYNVVVAVRQAGYSGGAIDVYAVEDGQVVSEEKSLNASGSDIVVRAHNDEFFVVGRYNMDNLTRYYSGATSVPLSQLSLRRDENQSSPNVYDLAFVEDNDALLIPYGVAEVSRVDPTAATQSDLFKEVIDLTNYTLGSDGTPEAVDAIVVGDKAYVLLQQQNNWTVEFNSTLVTIDLQTNLIVGDALDLGVRNAQNLTLSADASYLLVAGQDSTLYGEDPKTYNGGIAKVDLNQNTVSLLIDDGDITSHPYGYIRSVEVMSNELGYFLGAAGYEDDTLYRFDPRDGTVLGSVPGFESKAIKSITSDGNGLLWIALAGEDNTITAITTDGTVHVKPIKTSLVPIGVAIVSN
ncbi:MAG: hypothetical protein HWE20_02970 [Gammaproteobacteria bacterium]|nr:hypothetical protein [Gammaproteobacteria bacterium]